MLINNDENSTVIQNSAQGWSNKQLIKNWLEKMPETEYREFRRLIRALLKNWNVYENDVNELFAKILPNDFPIGKEQNDYERVANELLIPKLMGNMVNGMITSSPDLSIKLRVMLTLFVSETIPDLFLCDFHSIDFTIKDVDINKRQFSVICIAKTKPFATEGSALFESEVKICAKGQGSFQLLRMKGIFINDICLIESPTIQAMKTINEESLIFNYYKNHENGNWELNNPQFYATA
jgi:hypothetical protein